MSSNSINSIEKRLQIIEDQLALNKLINTYCRRADSFDWDGWSKTLTPDTLFDFEGGFGIMRGRQMVMETCRAAMDPVYHDFMHCIVNVDVDVDGGDTATGTGNIIFAALTDKAIPTNYLLMGGRYDWRFQRTPEGWQIAHTKLCFIWNNGADREEVFVPVNAKVSAAR